MLFPETTKKSNKAINPFEPWMSQGIMVSRKRKNLLASLSLKNPTRVSVAEFRAFRNLYNQVIRSAKKIYFQKQLADNQKNLRKTWQILFSTINKNTKKSNIISHLTVNGLDIEDQLSMACHFNKFFSEIATKTVSNINISNKDPTGLNSFRFSDKNLTKEEVLEATKLLLDKKNT